MLREPKSTRLKCVSDPARILLAEDDAELRVLLAAALRRRGFHVTAMPDGRRLLEVVEAMRFDPSQAPDAIVSDVNMPGASGLQILSRLRRADVRIPVVLITAYAEPEIRAEARRLGAAALLSKPFEIEQLRSTLEQVISSSPTTQISTGG